MLTYKVQLYPSKQQQAKFIEQLDICRKLYNKLLEEYKKAREKGEKITQIKTQFFIVSLKNNSMPELKERFNGYCSFFCLFQFLNSPL